jgi:hypothetical protein
MIIGAGASVSGRNTSARRIVPSVVGTSTSKPIRMPSLRENTGRESFLGDASSY